MPSVSIISSGLQQQHTAIQFTVLPHDIKSSMVPNKNQNNNNSCPFLLHLLYYTIIDKCEKCIDNTDVFKNDIFKNKKKRT